MTAAAVALVSVRIEQLFAQRLHLEVPSPATDLLETGVLDSLGLVDLLVHLEREFGVVVSLADLDLAQFRSLESIAEFVAGRLAGRT
jgi:acyl carrier protein